MRTSETDPIRVDFVAVESLKTDGLLGLTFAPGKKDPFGSWDRDLEADLDRLRKDYKGDVLVCLIERHEFEMLEIPDLLERAEQKGLKTIWYPIKDLSAPKQIDEFVKLIKHVKSLLEAGRTIVIHCRGGLGRSGLVAASCLIACGYQPSNALRLVRNARPGAVETWEQEQFVMDFSQAWLGRG